MPGVYILNDPSTNYLKIGRATNLEERILNLRTANPRLELVKWIETDFGNQIETYLHNRFVLNRREGEYFDIEFTLIEQELNEVLALIDSKPHDAIIREVSSIQEVSKSREATNDELIMLSEILKIKSEIQKLEFKVNILLDKLKVSIGENSGLKNWATFRPFTRLNFDQITFKNEKPEIYKNYCKQSTIRYLKIRPFIKQNEELL
jgi:hypothetical protein